MLHMARAQATAAVAAAVAVVAAATHLVQLLLLHFLVLFATQIVLFHPRVIDHAVCIATRLW